MPWVCDIRHSSNADLLCCSECTKINHRKNGTLCANFPQVPRRLLPPSTVVQTFVERRPESPTFVSDIRLLSGFINDCRLSWETFDICLQTFDGCLRTLDGCSQMFDGCLRTSDDRSRTSDDRSRTFDGCPQVIPKCSTVVFRSFTDTQPLNNKCQCSAVENSCQKWVGSVTSLDLFVIDSYF